MKTSFKAPMSKNGSYKFLVTNSKNKTMISGNSGSTSYSPNNAQIIAVVKTERELSCITEQFLKEGFKFVINEEF